MSEERFTVVALPHSRDVSAEFHVALFITPRLIPDDPVWPLSAFESFATWTANLRNAEIELHNESGMIRAEPVEGELDPDVWAAMFSLDTPVRAPDQPDWTGRHWRTFRAIEVHDTAKLISVMAVTNSPIVPGTPDWDRDPLTKIFLNTLGVNDDLSVYDESEFTRDHDTTIGEGPREGGVAQLHMIERSIEKTKGAKRALLELHRARRFYERPESAATPIPRPIDGAKREQLPRPEPDFHEQVSLLSDHPGVLHKLGLIVRLRVLDLDKLAASEWLAGTITIDGGAVCMPSRTRCAVVGPHMVTVPRTEEWVSGRLRIGDQSLFGLLDLDADGAALKTERFLYTLPRLLHASRNGADVNTATPALRTGGLTVVQHRRALETQTRMARQREIGRHILGGGGGQLLDTEDVTQGYRVEVFDETADKWFSLHARRIDAEVIDHGLILEDFAEEGFVQTTTASETRNVTESPIHVHEAMFSWGGWSLSAPRPGKRVRHFEGEEIVEDPEATVDPVTSLLIRSAVEPGTLPRLRYGRSYAFRAWAVDLAGNSRPHTLGAPSHATPRIANEDAGPMPGTIALGAPPGLEVELRRAAVAAVEERRNMPMDRDELDPTVAGAITGVGGVDEVVLSRLRARRSEPLTRMGRAERLASVDRASLVGQAFEEMILDPGVPLIVNPGYINPAVVTGSIGPIDDAAPSEDLCVTQLQPFLRWEPVQPPAVVLRHRNSPGESLLQLVIRSGVTQDPETLKITVTPPEIYSATHGSYRDTSERHLVSPKSSQSESELHGMFDTAIGSSDKDDHRRILGTVIRESGTLFDVDVPRLDDPMIRERQDGIELVADSDVVPDALPLTPPGTPPPRGQYVIHNTDQLRVPYLPDPVARGISLVFPDAGRDRQLMFPFGTEGFTTRYNGEWPEPESFRLVLEGADDLTGRLDGSVLRLGLPPGDVQRFRLSSSLDRDDLDLFGFWRSLPESIRRLPVAAEAVADGWLWIFTPSDQVTLVHAVPRPLEAPHSIALEAVREKGSTNSSLIGGVDVHGPSTELLTAEASWTEFTDDLVAPTPHRSRLDGIAFTSVVRPEEDVALLIPGEPPDDGGNAKDERIEISGFGPVWLHRAVHKWGDTKHRNVSYRFRASTRYREYFQAESLAPKPPSDDTIEEPTFDDGQSVVGAEVTVSVPSAARPAAPVIHSVLPLLRWEIGTEPEQPMAVRRSRRAGVRIYLERPWYSSGEGELLAVLVAPGGADDAYSNPVSQWGADPIWRSSEVSRRGMYLEFDNLIWSPALEYESDDARPVVHSAVFDYDEFKEPPVDDETPGKATKLPVMVFGYRPQFNPDRRLWYVDVAIDPGDRIWPFVRLAVARYQPDSIDGCHLSEPVKCDFVQLLPERTASVSRTDVRHVRVVVSGPVGTRGGPKDQTFPPPAPEAEDAVRRNRRVLARLEYLNPNMPTDLGWEEADVIELQIRGIGRSGAEAAWVGELTSPVDIPLATPGDQPDWRVAIQEWELLLGDSEDLGGRGPRIWEPRLVYADEIGL